MSIAGYGVATVDEFVGHELGVSDWVTVDQTGRAAKPFYFGARAAGQFLASRRSDRPTHVRCVGLLKRPCE
jgi:hypothetical protein